MTAEHADAARSGDRSGATAGNAAGFAGSSSGVHEIFDPRRRSDPYPLYRALREAARCHWLSAASPRLGVITRHADCVGALQEPVWGHVPMETSAFRPVTEQDEGLRSMLRANPPTHTRLRRLVSRAFTPATIARFRPMARALSVELLDAAADHDEVDLVEAFARPLPLRVICSLLGVPARDEKVFGAWASALTRGLDPDQVLDPVERAQRTEATRAFAEYFTELIARRRAEPADDLLSDLIAVQEQGDRLSVTELLDICVLLLVAGYDTTVNLVANAVLALARDPGQYAALRADRELVPAAIEETLRHDPPVQWTGRTALADTELAGQTFQAGDGVVLVAGAAHRDPEVFTDPDRFDITRYASSTVPAPRHLGFGHGLHYCLGAPLARLEAETMLTALLDRVTRLEVTAEPTYRPHLAVRGVEALRMRLTIR
ncbi:cytochrome P450 [Frankia sp. QA3]|uniref:cytochrome P450 n=1 Tax=Frankia sp. QA3 TaxID=710111 RepID=UPI000269C259|nr:cytochrome P450 [Frankia sp. QA3]EIV91673.1 cytochrome P450 [Frankia sp. QA3]